MKKPDVIAIDFAEKKRKKRGGEGKGYLFVVFFWGTNMSVLQFLILPPEKKEMKRASSSIYRLISLILLSWSPDFFSALSTRKIFSLSLSFFFLLRRIYFEFSPDEKKKGKLGLQVSGKNSPPSAHSSRWQKKARPILSFSLPPPPPSLPNLSKARREISDSIRLLTVPRNVQRQISDAV